MQARRRHSLYRFILALGIAVPGLIGILAIQAKAVAGQAEALKAALQAGTPSATPSPQLATATPPFQTSTGAPTLSLPTSSALLPSGLYAYIEAPKGLVPKPYVILTAFSALPGAVAVTIQGFLNTEQFICTQSPCAVDLQTSSRLVFAAYTASGESSETVIASVSVTRETDGYLVTIDTVSQFSLFSNACSIFWGVSDEANVPWDDFVQFPYQLHTKKTLHTLATELILNGIVDAHDCPAGGLNLSLNWPTACGLEKASSKMIEWQNQFDDHIWLASKNQGVPPKILKTLFEIESQFWPGNARFYLDEFGLGQLNQLGVDVLLRRDPTLFQQACQGVLSDCATSYLSLNPQQQAMIRGAVVKLVDASCADCQYGFDLNRAKESVALFARLLVANCQQVDTIINSVIVPDTDADAATATAAVATIAAGGNTDSTSYDDLWRFTFLSYHSGLNCFREALVATKKAKQPVNWENIAKRLKCKGAENYVDGFMNNLASFDFYLLDTTQANVTLVAPTIIPTRTAIPTPTVYISNATVKVQVYIDRNGNNSPDEGEWVNAMTVLVETSTNQQITKRTENGIAIFDMSGFTPGISVNVSLPGLYRNQRFDLPQTGEVTVTFKFEQPPLPTTIP
jgi:hypothetical protein